MWDERYSVKEYVYGKDPNTLFRSQIDRLIPGKLLMPGEGEGRNAVYAASRGWRVHAFDTSTEGQKKAFALAQEKGVIIDYSIASYFSYDYKEGFFDAAGLFFTHQPPEMRKEFHRLVASSLKPGGVLILEAFHKDQINRNTGGPRDPRLLFSAEDLMEDLAELEIQKITVQTRKLDEGLFHQGMADLVQLVAKKPMS